MVAVYLMQRRWPLCPSFFFSSLFNTKLPLSPLGLHHAPFDSVLCLSEVRQMSLAPLPIIVVQPKPELSVNFLRTTHLSFSRFTSTWTLSTIWILIPPPLSLSLSHTHTHMYVCMYVCINSYCEPITWSQILFLDVQDISNSMFFSKLIIFNRIKLR